MTGYACHACRRPLEPGAERIVVRDPEVAAGRDWRWSAPRVQLSCDDCEAK